MNFIVFLSWSLTTSDNSRQTVKQPSLILGTMQKYYQKGLTYVRMTYYCTGLAWSVQIINNLIHTLN